MATTYHHESLTNLSEDTVSRLNDLIRINIDSAEGFARAAKAIDVPAYVSLFESMSNERAAQAQELRSHVLAEGEEPVESGSVQGAVHRWWLTLRDKMTTSEAYDVLAEAERGEDHIKHLYEDVLKETAGSPVNDLLTRQYSQVKRGHDKVRDLRDAEKAMEKRK